MDQTASKSPDPPDDAFDVATGEDSQRSTTLDKALKPMPDTRPDSHDYQRISPESHALSAAPFISRPTHPDADEDLSIGFIYDKPLAVKPGQFSGRKQPKPFAPAMVHSTAKSGTEPPKDSPPEHKAARQGIAMVRANPARPALLSSPQDRRVLHRPPHTQAALKIPLLAQSNEASHRMQNYQPPQIRQGLPATAPLPPKKHPFKDYQPTYRAPNPQSQMPTPDTSFENPSADQVVGLLSEHDPAHNKGTSMQQSHQGHLVKPSTAIIAQQKFRTSLQNDVSVSSAQPSRAMPGSSPRTSMVNRPIKDSHRRTSRSNTPVSRPRSTGSVFRSGQSIVKSNSKVKRTCSSTQIPSSFRSSSRYSYREEETPSMKHRSRWTPAELLQDRFHQKMVSTAADLADCFNDKFADIGAEVDQHLQTISDLKKGMSKQRHDLTRYKECIVGKDDKIQQLEEHCDQLLAKVDSTRQELDARSTKVSKLEEKCRSYKEFLNNAIAEQQELYKATKVKCDGTITKMQAEESRRSALQESERKKAEVTRERLSQLVESTVNEYKQKERDFNNQLEGLSQKIQEREADVLRERETARALLHQNGSINKIENILKIFGSQLEGVVGKVNKVVAQHHQEDNQSAKDMNVKLDQIMQCLRLLDERTLPTAELSKEMHELNKNTVISISEKFEPIIAAQLRTKTNIEALYSSVEACMNDVWEELDDRQTMLEDCFIKKEAEREQHAEILQHDIEELERDVARQNQLLLRSEQHLREREATIDKLKVDIADQKQANEQYLAESEQLDRLREEHAKLKDKSAAKASLVSELQGKLQESSAKLATEEQKHQEYNVELQRLMEGRVAEAKAAQVRAVETAQQDAILRMNEIKADIDARFIEVLEQRMTLQKELDEANRKLETIEAESSRTSEKATNLEEDLRSCRAEVAKGREQASLKDVEQQAAKEQQLKIVQDLQNKLANADAKFNTLSGHTKSYDKSAQTILLSMKQWTQNYATIESMARELRKTKDESGILTDVDSNLKPLVELQLLQKAVSQYCQTQSQAAQVLPEDLAAASQVFSTNDSLAMSAASVLDRLRRVTVKSPASHASSPHPPSVQIEQERRRTGEQPKSILKLLPQARQKSEEEAQRELLSNTALNRGPYNRLVAGRKSKTGHSVTRLFQRGPSSSDSAPDQKTGTGSDAGETKKRKPDLEQQSDRKEMRSLKRKKSTSSTLEFSSPPERNKPGFDSVPQAPRKTGWRAMASNEQPSSPGQSQSSQEQSQSQLTASRSLIRTGELISTRERPTRSNRDPLSLFYERRAPRANEDSQESLTLSQDLGDNRTFSISSQYSFGP